MSSMNNFVGKTFGEVNLHRKDIVLPLAAIDSSMNDKRQCRSTPCNSPAGSYLSRSLTKILLNVWRLNWPLVSYQFSIRHPCAIPTRLSCISGGGVKSWSNHSAMCVGQRLSSGQHVCRGWRISTTSVSVWIWPKHPTHRDAYKVCSPNQTR